MEKPSYWRYFGQHRTVLNVNRLREWYGGMVFREKIICSTSSPDNLLQWLSAKGFERNKECMRCMRYPTKDDDIWVSSFRHAVCRGGGGGAYIEALISGVARELEALRRIRVFDDDDWIE